jgi:hypothetical protein
MDQMQIYINVFLTIALIVLSLALIYATHKRAISSQKGAAPTTTTLLHSQTNIKETRQHPRFEVSWPVTIEVGQDKIQGEGEIANISLGGAFIQCKEPLSLNETFSIAINIPDRQPIPAKVQVVWSNSSIPDDKVVRRGMGVRFLEIADNDRKFIQTQSQALSPEA